MQAGRNSAGGPGVRRTPDDLMRELHSRGSVRIEARPHLHHVASSLMLVISWIPIIGGIALLALEQTNRMPGSTVGAGMALVGVVGLLGGVALRRSNRRAPGTRWVVDARGITIEGIGPIPWGDLEPTAHRLEPSPYNEGLQRALVMPLSPWGEQRAQSLGPEARRILNASTRARPITGPRPLRSLRVNAMKDMPARDFAVFLDRARAHFSPRRFPH